MTSRIARQPQAIVSSQAQSLFNFCIQIIDSTFHLWPRVYDLEFVYTIGLTLMSPTFRVTLCPKTVHVNNIEIVIEAFRIQLSLWGRTQPMVYYCPRHILSPGYVRGTIEPSLREEIIAWTLHRSRVNSLMVETARNLQRKMRCLLVELPMEAYILQTPPLVRAGSPIAVPGLGSSQVSVVHDEVMKITFITVDGYSISREYERRRVPEPAALKTRLLALYHAAL